MGAAQRDADHRAPCARAANQPDWGLAIHGALALREIEGYVDGAKFIAFLREDLGPHLRPGTKVVMDGPSIHKVPGVKEALAEFGATAVYLPPYSPELNPIEMTWGWIKNLLKGTPPRQVAALRSKVRELWQRVPMALCEAWVRHSGYHAST